VKNISIQIFRVTFCLNLGRH